MSGAVSADPGSRYADPIWPPFGGDRSRAARSTLVGPQSAEAAQLFALGDGFVIAQVVGGDGTVYALSFEGTISAVDGRTGEVDWTFQGLDIFSPALGPDGTLYVGIAARRGLRAGAGARRGRDLYVGTQGGLMAIAP